MEYKVNNFYEEVENFLDIYNEEANTIDLDLFLSVLVYKLNKLNSLSDRSEPIYSLWEDFNVYYEDKCKKYHNISIEFLFVIIRDWLETLSYEKKKMYVFSLNLFSDIDDDGRLVYKPKEKKTYTTGNVIEDFEREIILQMGDNKTCYFSTNELLFSLSKVIVTYLEYRDILFKDLILSGFYNTFKDVLFEEDWENRMQALLLRMDVSENRKRELLPRGCYGNLDINFSGFRIKVTLKEDYVIEVQESIENDIKKDDVVEKVNSKRISDDDVVKEILRFFQIKVIENLDGKKSSFFSYIDIIKILAEVVKPYMEGYNIEYSPALSGFCLEFKNDLLSEDWTSLIEKHVSQINYSKKLETLPHARYLSFFNEFHPYSSGEGKIYIKLEDNVDVILDKNNNGKTEELVDEVKTDTYVVEEKESENIVSEATNYPCISQLIIEEFQKKVIRSLDNKNGLLSEIDLDKLLICLGEVLVPYIGTYKRFISKDPTFIEYYKVFGNILDFDNWELQLKGYCYKLPNKIKASLLTILNRQCLYVDIPPVTDNPVYIIVKESLLEELFKNEEVPLLFRSMVSNIDEMRIEEEEEFIETVQDIVEFEDVECNEEEICVDPFLDEDSIDIDEKLFRDRGYVDKSQYTANDFCLDTFWSEMFVEGDPLPPFWRHRMSDKSYRKLKELLNKCIDENRQKAIDNHSLKLAFFISEWYRREYDGRGNRVLQDITDDSKKIWEAAALPTQLLFTTENTTRWLDSLYVLGGLPLEYCKTDYKDIIDRLVELKTEGITIWESEDLTNNETINQSLKCSNGSLHLFVNEILQDRYPFSEDDASLALISSFKGMIENGDNCLESSFKVIREYYKNEEYGIYREYRVRLKNLLKKRYISYEQIRPYGIKENMPSFVIRFRFGNKDSFDYSKKCKLYFTNDYDGHFVGYGSADEIVIDDIPLYKVEKFTIEIGNGNVPLWTYPISFGSFVQLYSDGSGVWTDKQTSSANQTVVLYDSDIYEEIEGNIMLPLSDGSEQGKEFCWKDISDRVELKNKQSEEPILLLNDCTDYLLEFDCLDNTIAYTDDNKVKVCFQGEMKTMPLLLGKQSLTVYTIDEDGERSITEDYVLKYRLPNESRYQEWNNGDSIQQGILFLKCGNVKQEVYYLPLCENDIVTRDSTYHTIEWNNEVEMLKGESFYQDEDTPTHLDKGITIDFQLGNSDCYVVIPIYRPYTGLFLYKNNELLRIYQNSQKIELPFILQDIFHVVSYGHKPCIKWIGGNSHAYYGLDEKNEMKLESVENTSVILKKWKEVECVFR